MEHTKPARPPSLFRRVDDDVKPLFQSRKDEVAHELIVSGFVDYVLMFSGAISLPQPLLADSIGYIQDMQLARRSPQLLRIASIPASALYLPENREKLPGAECEQRSHRIAQPNEDISGRPRCRLRANVCFTRESGHSVASRSIFALC